MSERVAQTWGKDEKHLLYKYMSCLASFSLNFYPSHASKFLIKCMRSNVVNIFFLTRFDSRVECQTTLRTKCSPSHTQQIVGVIVIKEELATKATPKNHTFIKCFFSLKFHGEKNQILKKSLFQKIKSFFT